MKVSHHGQRVTMPDFLVVGAMRSGTTSLYAYLDSHPEIFMPSLKEPQFFSYLGEPVSPHPPEIRSKPWNIDDYEQLFERAHPGQIIGEASTSYLYVYPRTQKNIKTIYGEQAKTLKIIGVLRNPVDRAWSIYTLKRQGGDWTEDFLTIAKKFEAEGNLYQYYNFFASGLYFEQVKAYQDMFPLTKFFMFEELVAEPERVVRECLQLVGVKDTSVPSNVGRVYNLSGVARNSAVAPIYRFLFGRNRLKGSLKEILPRGIRAEIKRKLGAQLIKKAEMPLEVKEYLLPKYEEDLRQLAKLFQNEHQRKIVEGWLA